MMKMRPLVNSLLVAPFLMFSSVGNPLFAQASRTPDNRKNDSLIHLYDSLVLMNTAKYAIDVNHSGEKMLSGVVVVPDGNYEQVTIQLLGSGDAGILTVKPDRNGKFTIELDWSKQPASLWIYAYGYVSEKLWLHNQPDLKKLKVSLVKVKPTNSLPPKTE